MPRAYRTPKQRAYRTRLRRQIANAKQRDAMHSNGICAPAAGWKLIARRRLTAGGIAFPAGSELLPSQCGRNLRALLDSGSVWWAPPGQNVTAQSSPLPEPPKPAPTPPVEVIDVPDDAPESYRKSLELLVERCDGDAARANDLMMASPAGRDLYLRAVKIACAKEAQRRGKVSISPSLIGM
jgi:hypothetical protein